MFSFFNHKKPKEKQSPNPIADKVVASIVTKCIRAQEKWANYMQRKTEGLSHKAKMYCLLLFCLLSVVCSFYLIFESFTGTSKQSLGFAPINVPIHSTQTGEEATRSFHLITKKEFERIARFHHYVESLGRSVSGAKIRDSLLSMRPGLMDSIRVIEKLYQLQTLKK
jgi:hypothetical protein